MIRAPHFKIWIALGCLLALPAAAQDFRDLRPGMPPSDLAALGEPEFQMRFGESDPLAEAVYPLPFGQRLQVYYTPERIISLTTWGDPVALTLGTAPVHSGLQSFVTTMGDVIDMAGSEGSYFEARGQFEVQGNERTWWLVYDVPSLPGMLLELQFLELNATAPLDEADGVITLPRNVPLAQASLYHPDYLTEFAPIYGDTLTARPGAAPFALPIAEAFPLTELP